MVETHVVFETIKIGEEIRKGLSFESPGYHTYFYGAQIRPIADVLPFHIVDGHITTSLNINEFEIMLANMDPEGIMSPPLRFKFSPSQGSVVSGVTNFFKLYPSMSGPDLQGKGRINLDKITHIYLVCMGGPADTVPVLSNDFLSMTLIIEKEN
jgi:hypothetical protein